MHGGFYKNEPQKVFFINVIENKIKALMSSQEGKPHNNSLSWKAVSYMAQMSLVGSTDDAFSSEAIILPKQKQISF